MILIGPNSGFEKEFLFWRFDFKRVASSTANFLLHLQKECILFESKITKMKIPKYFK